MRAVNLLPPEESNGRSGAFDRALVVGIAVTVLVLAVLAGAFVIEKANASTQRQRLATAQTALVRAQSQQPSAGHPAPKHLETPVVLSQEEPWHVALDSALASRVSWDVLLKQLEYVVPDKITITNVTVGGTGTTASGTITIGGTAFSSNDIAVLISTLARVPHVSEVALVNTTAGGESTVQTFQVTAQMALPAAATPPAPVTDTTTTTGG